MKRNRFTEIPIHHQYSSYEQYFLALARDLRKIPLAMDRPLTALFVDCDSYFASVEQHLDPALRGRPVGVAPVMAESTCCIAASYEAKAYGVKTGTPVHEARKLCPGIAIIEAKPPEYVKYHHQIIAAVRDCIHVEDEQVLSIDEMWAWLPYNWREPDFVEQLGLKIKRTVAEQVSPVIKVSIGAGPNKYLAKTASKMRKPDGLFIIEAHQLPEILHPLSLRDLHGVAKSMEARLHALGIHTTAQLCAAPKPLLHHAWNGVLGDRLWHLLRGEEVPDMVTSRHSISHGHILPPHSRMPDKAWPILCKLLHKACERLRAMGMLTGALHLELGYLRGPSYQPAISFPPCDATLHLIRLLGQLWKSRPDPQSKLVSIRVILSKLTQLGQFTPDLFQDSTPTAIARRDEEKQRRLDEAVDQLRTRYGRSSVYFGTVQSARDAAPMRIAFNHIPKPELEQDY
jgi:DNA polymerase IV